MFVAGVSTANAKKLSLMNSLQWPIEKINTVHKTKLFCNTTSCHLHVLKGEVYCYFKSMGIISSDIVGLKEKERGKKKRNICINNLFTLKCNNTVFIACLSMQSLHCGLQHFYYLLLVFFR